MEKSSNILLSYVIIALLILQAALSISIVQRLDRFGASVSQPTEAGPQFIEDVSIDNDPMKGNPDAAITIVEFADFQCPACAQSQDDIAQILEDYEGQVNLVFRDFPLPGHPHAFSSAIAAHCAGEQGMYWEMHDALFAGQSNLNTEAIVEYASQIKINDLNSFEQCIDNEKYANEVNKDIADAVEYQVNATPTFFINGHRVVGGSYEQLKQTIDQIIEEQDS